MGRLVFMKNFILRKIDRALRDRDEACAVLQPFLLKPASGGSKTIAMLRTQLLLLDEEVATDRGMPLLEAAP